MGNRQLKKQEIDTLMAETELSRDKILKAFERFKTLAG